MTYEEIILTDIKIPTFKDEADFFKKLVRYSTTKEGMLELEMAGFMWFLRSFVFEPIFDITEKEGNKLYISKDPDFYIKQKKWIERQEDRIIESLPKGIKTFKAEILMRD